MPTQFRGRAAFRLALFVGTNRWPDQVANRVELHGVTINASRILSGVDVASTTTPRLLAVGSVVKRCV